VTVTESPPTSAQTPRKKRRRALQSGRLGALLVSPTLLVLTLVIVLPMLAAFRQSLYGEPGLNPATGFVSEEEPFIGLGNYAAIFGVESDRFFTAFYNTSFFTVTTVTLETLIGVAMALIMHRAMRGRAFVRASILIPWAIPTAVSAVLWRWIFNPSYGVANAMLPGQILWTTEGFQAQVAVIIAEVWKTAPFIGLLTLAGLQVISDEIYEAAKIDGASALRRFWHITLPLVKPALLVAVLFRLLDALRMFDLPYILIGPRKDSVETLSMLVHDEATNTLSYGAGAAYAVVLFFYVFAVVWVFVSLLGADIIGDRDQHSVRVRPVRALFARVRGARA
jgi:multiple sugar transport system permease protein